MSYFIATKVSINKDGTIGLVGHDNNVFPSNDHQVELSDLKTLYEHLRNGTIQPLTSANGYKWSALQWFLEHIYGSHYTFEQFRQVLEHPDNKGSFIFVVARPDGDHYINGKYVTSSKDIATRYTFWQALYHTFAPSKTLKWYKNIKCVNRKGETPWFWKFRNNELAKYDL
jgi:hypothetical protein